MYPAWFEQLVDAHVDPIVEPIRADPSSNHGAIHYREIIHNPWWWNAEACSGPSKASEGRR